MAAVILVFRTSFMLIFGAFPVVKGDLTADCRFTTTESKAKLAKNQLIAIVLPIALIAGLAFNYCGLIMEASLIAQGLDLLLYGMGTVFTFLTLLVGITAAMSGTVNRFVQEDPEVAAAGSAVSPKGAVEPRIAKVIQAAIDQHRGRK
jgi:oxaloacetate decarboxylase gamma subunit